MIRFTTLLVFLIFSNFSIAQKAKKSATIQLYWDASYTMKDKDLLKEIEYLKHTLKERNTKTIKLTIFTNEVNQNETYAIQNDTWDDLISSLKEISYDGASNFEFLFDEPNDVPSILFTDGNSTLEDLRVHYGKKKMDVVCATSNCNSKLERLSIYSAGNYHQLQPQNQNFSKRADSQVSNSTTPITVSGVVTDENGVLEDVAVILKGKSKGTLSLEDGSFAIRVVPGDSLSFQFHGKRKVVVAIKKNSKFVKINLEEAIESLDEVVVVQKEKIQWLPKEKVLGYSLQTINKDDITVSGATNISTSVAGKISGVNYTTSLSQSIIRGFSSITGNNYPLVIIDGAPAPRMESNGSSNFSTDILNFVNPNDVVSIKVLKGLAAANRYGAEGSSGVILITTKNGENKLTEKKVSKNYNSALLRDNNFTGDLNVSEHQQKKVYLQDLEAQETVEESYQLYLTQRDQYKSDPYYFINVHNIFQASDADLAEGILNSALAIVGNDIPALRTIAFYHQQAKRYGQALPIYEKIVQLDSSRIQGYRDLANAHIQAGTYEKALKGYSEIVSPDFEPMLAPQSVVDVVTLELKNLIYRKGKQLNIAKISSKYKSSPRYDARVLLEWNDPEAEFEIEFISPDRKISKWSHTTKDNPERMKNERIHGFHMEESLLSLAQKGNWYLNVRTIGVKENAPLFLKFTVQYYYGQAGQYAEGKVFAFNMGSNERIVSKVQIR